MKKNQKILDKVIDKKIVNKKSLNLVGILKRKINVFCIKL